MELSLLKILEDNANLTPEQLAVLRDWERTALMAGDGNMV